MNNMIKNVRVSRILSSAALSTATSTSSAIDMQGFEGVMCTVSMGAVPANGVTTVSAYSSTASGGTYTAASTITATVTAASTADVSETLVQLDLVKPMKRFVKFRVAASAATVNIDGAVACQYGGARKAPISASTTVAVDGIAAAD